MDKDGWLKELDWRLQAAGNILKGKESGSRGLYHARLRERRLGLDQARAIINEMKSELEVR